MDEVLAVGDSNFQKKCLGKMEDVASEGRTILFVSHNMAAMRALCKNGLLLNSGLHEYSGEIDATISIYESISFESTPLYEAQFEHSSLCVNENKFFPRSIQIIQDQLGVPIKDDRPFLIRIRTECTDARTSSLVIGLIISDETGRVALHTDSAAARGGGKVVAQGIGVTDFEVPPGAFKPGKYKVRVSGSEPMVRLFFAIEEAVAFEVVSENTALIRHGVSAWKASTSPSICRVLSSAKPLLVDK